MKLLIVSDSHGRWEILKELVEEERPDSVLHLGDYIGDAQKLSMVCRETEIEAVPGNCDGLFVRGEINRILSYEGVSFFLTHGHEFHVKSGLDFLERVGNRNDVDVVLFGHTHRALIERRPSGIWMVNPGSVGGVHAPRTYVNAYVENSVVRFELKTIE